MDKKKRIHLSEDKEKELKLPNFNIYSYQEAIHNSEKFVLKLRVSLREYTYVKDSDSDLLDYLKSKGVKFKDFNKSNHPYGKLESYKDFESGAIIYKQTFSKKDLEEIGKDYLLMSCEEI